MNKTFREIFEEERQLSSALAKHWGYDLRSIGLDARLKRDSDARMPAVANINTLRLAPDIPKTDRILQIEEELRAIENGRLLAKFTEEAARGSGAGAGAEAGAETGGSAIMALMEEKVREYNHIVAHRHLDKKYQEETRRILKIEKDEAEKLIEKIHAQEQRLVDGNLSTQIRTNKYLAHLYKSYRNHAQPQRLPKQHSKVRTIISEPANSIQHKQEEIPKLQRVRRFSKQNSEKKAVNSRSDRALLINVQPVETSLRLTEANFSSYHPDTYPSFMQGHGSITDRTANRRAASKQEERLLRTVHSPFADRERLEQYRKIEKTSNNNYATLEVFKDKIREVKGKAPHRAKTTRHNKPSPHDTLPPQATLSSLPNDAPSSALPPSPAMDEQERTIYNSIIAENKEKYQEQKLILAELLKKKHNKYNKVGLSRVLVKYDEESEAKQMLKGELQKKDARKQQDQDDTLQPHHGPSKRTNHVSTVSQGLTELYDEGDDHQNYERMCKNEKINLLLKHR